MPDYTPANFPQSGASFDQLPGMFTAFRGAFDEELQAALSFDFNPYVLTQDLNGGLVLDLETVRGIAIMKRWAGTKVVEDALTGFGNVIKTIPWEATEKIERREWNSNPNGLGLLTSKIAGLGSEAAQHVLRMFAAVLEGNGQSVSTLAALGMEADFIPLARANCLDGQVLFYASHPLANAATYSNLSTGGHSTSNLTTCITAMKKIPEWLHGRRIDNRPDVVMTPIALTPRYKQLLESDSDPDSSRRANNPNKGVVKVVENPFLLDDTKAYLVNTHRSQMKPVVYAVTKPASLVQQVDPQSDTVFLRGEFLFGAESDGYVMVPGHPFTVYRIATS